MASEAEERKELLKIAEAVIKGNGSANVKLPFRINHLDIKVGRILREMGYAGNYKVSGKGAHTYSIRSDKFGKAVKTEQAKAQIKNVKPNYNTGRKISVPEINLKAETVEEATAEFEKIEQFERQIKFAETVEEREVLKNRARQLRGGISGRINEIKMDLAHKAFKREKAKEHPSMIVETPPSEEKAGKRKYARKSKSTLAKDREVIKFIGKQGSSAEEFSGMHGQTIKEKEEEIARMLKEIEEKRSIISLYEHAGSSQESSALKQEHNKLVDRIKAEQERMKLLKEEKAHLDKLVLLKRPADYAGLSPSFLEKIMRKSSEKLSKEAAEQAERAKKQAEEAKKLKELAKWRPRRK